MAVAAAVCQARRKGRTLVKCINVTAQPQNLWARNLLRIFVQLAKDHICQSSNASYCPGVLDGQDMGKCPMHINTLLTQDLEVCTIPEQEWQVRHLLTAYVNVFSNNEASVGRATW